MISIENLLYCLSAIPYAKPPTGSLRFCKPEPLEKALPGIFDATSAGNACPQFNQGFLLGDEDCLTLTVYVPETKVVSAVDLCINKKVIQWSSVNRVMFNWFVPYIGSICQGPDFWL